MEGVSEMGMRKLSKYTCVLVSLLFIIPTVSAINAGSLEDIGHNKNLDHLDNYLVVDEVYRDEPIQESAQHTDQDFLNGEILSVEVAEILTKYSFEDLDESVKDFLRNFNKKMLERKDKFDFEYSYLPYIPFDITAALAKVDGKSGEITSVFPNADISQKIVPIKPINNLQPLSLDQQGSQHQNTRGTRTIPEADLEVTRVEWDYVNKGMANYFELETHGDPPESAPGKQNYEGGFQVGKTTIIKATITNKNPTIAANNVQVNFTIYQTIDGQPMQRNPTTYNLTSISTQQKIIEHSFTPTYASGWITVAVSVDYNYDPESSNDVSGWQRMPVMIWSADMESSGTNWGWQESVNGIETVNSKSEWTGDIGNSTISDNYWHTTNSPSNQGSPDHTQNNAWYHGHDGSVDRYEDTAENLYLETPFIDMGPITDGQDEFGELEEGWTYVPCIPMYSAMVTGELEWDVEQGDTWGDAFNKSDVIWVREFCDNNNDIWKEHNFYWGGLIRGDYAQLFSQINPGHLWNPLVYTGFVEGQETFLGYHFPFNVFIADGQGGNKQSNGTQNWSNPGVRFRCDFRGDDQEGLSTTETGAYFDDFITLGTQSYSVSNRVGITELTYPKTGGVPIFYNDTVSSFSVTVKNFGSEKQFNVKLTVSDANDPEKVIDEYTNMKSAGNLQIDQEQEILFVWSPTKEGDYILKIEADDLNEDWTPNDNVRLMYVHVRANEEENDVDVLVVDDDNSVGQGGFWRMNTENRMLKALDANDVRYHVYTVEYNESGPTSDIMEDYSLVIWMTGLDNEDRVHGGKANYKDNNPDWDLTLKTEDEDELEAFLSNKDKKLWLISPGYIFDQYGIDPESTNNNDFARKYLHIDEVEANGTTPNTLDGVSKTCMDGAEYNTYDTEPPWGFSDIGGIVFKDKYDDETEELFYQDDAHQYHNALFYKGKDFSTSYFAFNFYLIHDELDRADLVKRLLTSFDLMGGVVVEPFSSSEKVKTIYPGSEVGFRLKVWNTGKKEDKMVLTVTKPYEYNNWGTRWVVDGSEQNYITIPGLSYSSKIYLFITAPNVDRYSEYPLAGQNIKFSVKALSNISGLDNTTTLFAKIPAVGNISVQCNDLIKTIDAGDNVYFSLQILNETNGDDDITIQVQVTGDDLELVDLYRNRQPTYKKSITTILEPNVDNKDIELLVQSNSYTSMGWHNFTVNIKDEAGDLKYDSIDLAVRVNQLFRIVCNTTGDENSQINFSIDPNDHSKSGEDHIRKAFTINARNYGNGKDEISLSWETNSASDALIGWPEPGIYTKTNGETKNITSIPVDGYDEDKIGTKYGEESVFFGVYIPLSIDVGTYKLDFVIESSGTENGGQDELDNNRVTFSFNIVKPNLIYTKLNENSQPNFEFFDFEENVPIEEDIESGEYYIEKDENGFEYLTIEINVYISNDNSPEVDFEPTDIMLQISHIDDHGNIVYDENITRSEIPSSVIPIGEDQKVKFTFRWKPDTPPGTDPVQYSFKLTVDPENKIFETKEDDNSAEFELNILNRKKDTIDDDQDNSYVLAIGVILVIIIISVISFLLFNRKKKVNQLKFAEDDNDFD